MRAPKNRPATHIPTVGKFIFWDYTDEVFYACYDGLKIDLHGYERIQDAREALDEYVFETLRREAVVTRDAAANFGDTVYA